MQSWIRKAWWLILAGAVVWIFTAVNSHGYYHADEHYQIIEFAGLKLGTHAPEELAWEYKAQSRSALQPTLVAGLFGLLRAVGVTDPYTSTMVLRLIWSSCAFFLVLFVLNTGVKRLTFKYIPLVVLGISTLFWFMPFLGARFSSESFSGFLLLLALGMLRSKNHTSSTIFAVGVILGVSFLARFQIAFCLLGLGTWLLLFAKWSLKRWTFLGVGFFVSLLLGVALDYWFYGELTWSAYHYFDTQIVQDVVNTFGTSPWYFYLKQLLLAPTIPLGILFWLCMLVLLLKDPKSLWLWCAVPFILVHSLVPHKEVRFLFPLLCLLPVLVLELAGVFHKLTGKQQIMRVGIVGLLLVSALPNAVGLVVIASKSAGLGRTSVMKYIHEQVDASEVQLVHTAWSNPYNPWQSLPSKHYMDDITFSRFENISAYSDTLFDLGKKTYLSLRKEEVNNHIRPVLERDFELVLESVPPWVQALNRFHGGLDTGQIFMLYTPKQ
jgi:phosphatidylinositol glycan class B